MSSLLLEDKGVKGAVVNRTCNSLIRWSLEITVDNLTFKIETLSLYVKMSNSVTHNQISVESKSSVDNNLLLNKNNAI